MENSKYQSAIFDTVQSKQNNVVVLATAGSGKTTTITKASHLLSRNKKILFFAFNKSITQELRYKLPSYIDVSTLHSMGFKFLKGVGVNNNKDFGIAVSIVNDKDFKKKKDFYSYCYNLVDLSNFVRVNNVNIDDESLLRLSLKYTLEYNDKIYGDFIKLWELRQKSNNEIDYADMLYLPVSRNMVKHYDQYDIIFVDETQDLNTTQINFLEMLLKPNGRFIAVGDKWQSIYGFAGADTESLNKLLTKKNTVQLPLSISYRCARRIVYEAQEINNEIEFFEGNEEGIVDEGDIDYIKGEDLVICRNNRPLLHVYFHLISKGIKATIVGKEIEDRLRKVVKRHQQLKHEDLVDALDDDLSSLHHHLLSQGFTIPEKSKKYQEFVESIECVRAMIQFANAQRITLPIIKLIDLIFKHQEHGVKLMSIHKSKGLEANRVFIIMSFDGRSLMPSKFAEQDWEREQERNLHFVALTRAKKELYYIHL